MRVFGIIIAVLLAVSAVFVVGHIMGWSEKPSSLFWYTCQTRAPGVPNCMPACEVTTRSGLPSPSRSIVDQSWSPWEVLPPAISVKPVSW